MPLYTFYIAMPNLILIKYYFHFSLDEQNLTVIVLIMWHLQLTCEKWEDKLEISYELYQFVHTPKNCNEHNNTSKKFFTDTQTI